MKKIKEMNFIEFSKIYNTLTENDIENLFLTGEIKDLDGKIINAIFLRSNFEIQQKIMENEEIFGKLIDSQIKNSRDKNQFFRLLYTKHQNSLKYFLDSNLASKYFKVFMSYLDTFSNNELQIFLKNNDITSILINNGYDFSVDNIKNNIKTKYPYFKDSLIDRLIINIKNKMISPYLISKVKNVQELFVLSQFNLLINCEESYEEDFITLINGEVVPLKILENVKPIYINKLIDDMKNNEKLDADLFFEIAVKLYLIFGFDEAKKIVNGKYSYLNNASIKRIVDFNFKDSRREFRFNNQNKFFYHNIDIDLENSISKNDDTIIINILGNEEEENINVFKENFKVLNNKKEIIDFINAQINYREHKNLEKYTKKLSLLLNHKLNESLDKKTINYKKIGENLENISLNNVCELSQEEKNSLNKMLLGNRKFDNDALLRILFNNEALGLRLNIIINEFKKLNDLAIINNLSTNSVLDIIEILKTELYNVPANCKDIYLNTLVKILSSKKFLIKNDVDVLKETLKLHVERKYKVKSSIPTIKGKCLEYKYMIMPYDSEALLSIGADVDNCMRIGGQGEEFFRYCLTNEHSAILKIFDDNREIYYCPIVRSGNAIHINGIEPKVDNEKIDKIINVLKIACKEIMDLTFEDEQINFATVSDLHLTGKIKGLKKYDLECYLPIESTCNTETMYTDYNKTEINHFVLCEYNYKQSLFYEPSAVYYQDRPTVFEYNTNKEYDPERLNLLINMIEYSSIEYLNISDDEKQNLKENYKNLDVLQFLYIVGNKDWYIGIDKNYNAIAKLLPYDDRAFNEYYSHFMRVVNTARELKESSKKTKK